ncbi:MAG: hypothetical protein L6W00_10995 [Lentisphaeria bacterium]|nr:MAG: hypothetical protein L6W00_10995 [Lentisphaeria bacterium]
MELTLIPGQYGMLEINLHSNRSPGCCIAVFFDAPLPPPTGRTPLFIPAGFHLPGELHCCPGEYLHLLPGIHEIEGGTYSAAIRRFNLPGARRDNPGWSCCGGVQRSRHFRTWDL